MKQFFFVTAKKVEDLKACYILNGSEENLQFLGRVVDSNKLCFGGVVLPARLDDRVSHLKKYCTQYDEFKELLPNFESSHCMEDIVVLLLETMVINEAAFSEELKAQVVTIYNDVKERGGPFQASANRVTMDVDQEGEGLMAPPKPRSTSSRKPTEVELQIKKLLDNSESLYNSNVRLLKAVSEMHEEIAKLRTGQEQITNRLDDVASAGVNIHPPGKKFKCSFCETDDHGYKECEMKEPCIHCGLDNHNALKCFWPGNTCTFCKAQGHASKLHQVTDQKFRLKIMNTHGPENFAHFWAPEKKPEVKEVQAVETPVHKIQEDGQCAGQNRNQGGYQGKIHRNQEAKPYSRPQFDPWSEASRPRTRKQRR